MQGKPIYPGRHSNRRHRLRTFNTRMHYYWMKHARIVERELAAASRDDAHGPITNAGDWLGTLRLTIDLLGSIGI